jgi:hypothetical protein
MAVKSNVALPTSFERRQSLLSKPRRDPMIQHKQCSESFPEHEWGLVVAITGWDSVRIAACWLLLTSAVACFCSLLLKLAQTCSITKIYNPDLLKVAESPNHQNAGWAPCMCAIDYKDVHTCAQTRFTGPSRNHKHSTRCMVHKHKKQTHALMTYLITWSLCFVDTNFVFLLGRLFLLSKHTNTNFLSLSYQNRI